MSAAPSIDRQPGMAGEAKRQGDDASEVHIAGVLVHTRQPHTLEVCAAMSRFPGVEVHQMSPQGRVVLVVEGGSAKEIVGSLDAIRAIPGVLNVVLVYQHAESAAAMQEEIGP